MDDAYALDGDALSHLDDCNVLVRAAVPALWGVAALAAAALAFLLARRKRRLAGTALVVAPAVLIVAFAALGAWAALDFNGLFSAFHAVLFPQGNWTFSYDSLLISMYPLDFWMGMAGIWFATTLALSILAIVVGVLFEAAWAGCPRTCRAQTVLGSLETPLGRFGSCGNCARHALGHSAQAARTTPLP